MILLSREIYRWYKTGDFRKFQGFSFLSGTFYLTLLGESRLVYFYPIFDFIKSIINLSILNIKEFDVFCRIYYK